MAWNNPSNGFGTSGNTWLDDVEPTASSSVDDYANIQRQALREQDKGLDTLADIISRQKSMAQGIATEIDIHNEILDDITDAMDDNHGRLVRNTRNIAKVSRKSDTCCYWVVIVLLMIIIIVISVV
ncbi:syntaxin-8 [Tetranychus urticae]|uniref:t-SNARE coiled-coil homology domain-containing protein n=1 Tax=Tetranychus urticae TaxID=32264 RepID=T1KB97_TETUR|nr:syntaxin-8 [Tetranychus urticae]